MRKGDRVTDQPRTWYDGQPVANWPDPQFVGTVREVKRLGGVLCAWVKYDTGRKDIVSVDRLHKICKGGAA